MMTLVSHHEISSHNNLKFISHAGFLTNKNKTYYLIKESYLIHNLYSFQKAMPRLEDDSVKLLLPLRLPYFHGLICLLNRIHYSIQIMRTSWLLFELLKMIKTVRTILRLTSTYSN